MIKIISMMRKNPNVTLQEFKAYYERTHATTAAKNLTGYCWGYRRNYMLRQFLNADGKMREIDNPEDPSNFPYDVITEFWFPTQEAMDHVFAAFANRDEDAEDQRYLDLNSIRSIIVEEAVTDLPR